MDYDQWIASDQAGYWLLLRQKPMLYQFMPYGFECSFVSRLWEHVSRDCAAIVSWKLAQGTRKSVKFSSGNPVASRAILFWLVSQSKLVVRSNLVLHFLRYCLVRPRARQEIAKQESFQALCATLDVTKKDCRRMRLRLACPTFYQLIFQIVSSTLPLVQLVV